MDAIQAAERAALSGAPVDDVLKELRALDLDGFGEVFLRMPDPALPALSRILPKMADVEIQTSWTGNSGKALLQQSVAFVKSMQAHWRLIKRREMKDIKVLDFGCGYGRLSRLMY